MAYISEISGVDVQGIVNGSRVDQATIDFMRSARRDINLDAPKPHGSSLTDGRYWGRLQTADIIREEHQINDDDIYMGQETLRPSREAVDRPPPSRHLSHYLKFDYERASYIQMVEQSGAAESVSSFADIVASLAEVAAPVQRPWYYPGKGPDRCTGACRCGRTLGKQYVYICC